MLVTAWQDRSACYELAALNAELASTAPLDNTIIRIITRSTCHEARCVRRHAAVRGCPNPTLVGLARSKQGPINRGHGAQYLGTIDTILYLKSNVENISTMIFSFGFREYEYRVYGSGKGIVQ